MENKKDGLKAHLPEERKRCKSREGDIDYFNSETSQSEQKHPSYSYYKKPVRKAKHSSELKNIKSKTKIKLLNCQMSTTNDFNSELKETENALNIETLRNKTAKILSIPNNPELEMDFRATCSNYQTNSNLHDPLLMQAYQDYLQAYQQKTSLYTINWDREEQETKLEIYNTETETKEYKILETPEELNYASCIILLPNSKLFCFGIGSFSGIAVLIYLNGGVVEELPSGASCSDSSCIYFNNSIYCIGGKCYGSDLDVSNKFDLDQKRWIQLPPMPDADILCNSTIFNGNILISGYNNRKLLLYSIDINSFSTIPYKFKVNERKILINAGRLYLIEGSGSIYECEIESYTNWKKIGALTKMDWEYQVYCSYNKGGIYIGYLGDSDNKGFPGFLGQEGFSETYYCKFELNKKQLNEC